MLSTTKLLLPTLKDALDSAPEQLADLAEELHDADLADLVNELEEPEALKFMSALPVETVTPILEHVELDTRAALFAAIASENIDRAVAITHELAADDRADIYAEIDPELRKRLMRKIDEEYSSDIRKLIAYAEDTAGSRMTTDFVALPADKTVEEAITQVRTEAEDMETIYQAYAVDPHGTLLGVISLRDLVLAPATRSVDAIMNPNVVSIKATDDQEDAARIMAKYDLLALPVVNDHHVIVGIITVDDVLDVVEEEATEDAHRVGAVDPLERPYMSTPLFELVAARAPWLMVLFIAGIATASVLETYEDSIYHQAVIWFLPLIISSGGNSGSQSATLIIRAMALDRAHPRDAVKVLAKETLVGLILGVALASIGVIRVLATESTRSWDMALTMGAAVLSVVTVGAIVGSCIPLLLQRLKVDPAVSSTPFIASVLDIAGLVIYFEIAKFLLS